MIWQRKVILDHLE